MSGAEHTRLRSSVEHRALRTFPGLQRAVRAALCWGRECPLIGFTFVREVQARMAGTVGMTGGCRSWFLDHTGRNPTVWPWPTTRLRHQTRRFDLENYQRLTSHMDACRC